MEESKKTKTMFMCEYVLGVATKAAIGYTMNRGIRSFDLDDYIQEGCMGIYKMIQQGKITHDSTESFIFYSAYNFCRSYYRSYIKRHMVCEDGVDVNILSSCDNDSRVILEDIASVMSKKHAAWLHDMIRGDYSLREVARLNGRSDGAVMLAFKRGALRKGYISNNKMA